jgi:signal transduction histidine kinase/ActR/RegA family two-component response regulator
MQMQADQMTQIMRCVPAGVVLLDRKGVILLANPQAAGDLALLAPVTTGAPLATLGGRPLADFFTSPPTGKWHVVSWENRTFEVIARPVEGGPIPAGWVLVLRDVTEERVVQEQLQRQERLAAIGQLAAGIAHDFNNIMSVISIYAEMTAQAQGLTEHERARVASIDQQASRATRMIRQILDFSRRSVLERQAMDLLPLMQEQQKLLQQTLPESIAIRLVHEPGEYIIKGDPTRFQQLVMNLAFNARDAMPDGGLLSFVLGHLHVSSDLDAPLAAMKPGGWIRIAVQDTGAGMSPEILQHVFEPFFTTKPPGQGTGLGLAQVHGIVAQHDGHIAVESQVGMGTTFTVYVPAMVVVTPGEAAQYVMASTRRGNGERLLVVEDDAALRATLVELLGLWNYRATAVCDGEEALALLADNHGQVDLILSDVVMPRLGGIGLVKMLRNRAVTTPVILLTGHAMGQELEGLAALGLSAWLAKPPSAEQLASAIAAALHKGHAKGQP